MPDLNESKKSAGRVADFSWNASVILMMMFGGAVLLLIVTALAINAGAIKLPPQLCHYMVGNMHIEQLCK